MCASLRLRLIQRAYRHKKQWEWDAGFRVLFSVPPLAAPLPPFRGGGGGEEEEAPGSEGGARGRAAPGAVPGAILGLDLARCSSLPFTLPVHAERVLAHLVEAEKSLLKVRNSLRFASVFIFF